MRDEIAGVCHVVPDEDLRAYAVDGLVPKVVAYPKTAEQVAGIVQLASEHKWAVVPRGGGTQMSLGGVPRAVDVVICTTDMNQVLEYEPADLTCTVQAGIRLADLQRQLAENGQFLALDPPFPEQATIGGSISANASGPLRLRYGTCRDVLIGIKVVNPSGAITKGGGKVVKNVTGYDMCKLYTNALGTLGVVVEATFKLTPLPKLESTVLASYETLEEAYEAARAVHRSALPVRACELLSPAASQGRGYLLAVWIGGGPAAVERQNRDVTKLCEDAYAARRKPSIQVIEGEQLRVFWRGIEDFGRDEHESIAKLSVLPSHAGELLRRLPQSAPVVSHVLAGVTHVYGVDGRHLAPIAAEMEAYLVLEKCPLEMKQTMSVWGPTGGDFALMRRIKEQFDPDGILNPGRYVGGL